MIPASESTHPEQLYEKYGLAGESPASIPPPNFRSSRARENDDPLPLITALRLTPAGLGRRVGPSSHPVSS
jgi:hypothetical protein